jgi:hypothetical protein
MLAHDICSSTHGILDDLDSAKQEVAESVNMEPKLHGACFSKLQKIQNLNFEKIQKKYRSVVYDLFY